MSDLERYVVTIGTPQGPGEMEVPSTLGPDAAGRRAKMTAFTIGWGDLDELTVESVKVMHAEDCRLCEAGATVAHGYEPRKAGKS